MLPGSNAMEEDHLWDQFFASEHGAALIWGHDESGQHGTPLTDITGSDSEHLVV